MRTAGIDVIARDEARLYDPDNKLFQAVRKRQFGKSTCFLCGRRLGSKNRSDEHVIPKWVQDRFALWDEQLNLLNWTGIPYRQLTVPCCSVCNNVHLSRLESRVREAVLSGFEATLRLTQRDLFLWLGKIFYGLLFKEFFLRRDRKRPTKGRIVPRALLERYGFHHLLLQAVRLPFTFMTDVPASVLVVPLQQPEALGAQFDFRDSSALLTISIRLGSIGILAALQDGGAQRLGFFDELAKYQQFPLHPLQFVELTAQFFYKASLFNRIPKFALVGNANEIQVVQLPLAGFSGRSLFDPWDQAEYANTLSAYTGVPISQLYRPPDDVMTWLRGEDGNARQITLEDEPWPPVF